MKPSRFVFFFILVSFLISAFSLVISPSHAMDWRTWAELPVCRDGRIMPLDAFARSNVRLICGRNAPRIVMEDGKKRKFTAAELYFAWLAEPERWAEISFIPLTDVALREWMGLPLLSESGERLTAVSPADISRLYNSKDFNAKLARMLQKLEEAEALVAKANAEGTVTGTELEQAKLLAKESGKLREKLDQLESRYVAWLRLTFNPVRTAGSLNAQNEQSAWTSVLNDAAYVDYMGQIVSVSYVEQNLIFMLCGEYEPRISLRGAAMEKISAEELARIHDELKVPDRPDRRFTPHELYVSLKRDAKLWKHVPFLRLESVELRKILGLPTAPEGETPMIFVAPLELLTAMQEKDGNIRDALAKKTVSEEAARELNRLQMAVQFYCYWVDGQLLNSVPLGERFYTDFTQLSNCWFGQGRAMMGPAQPLDVQLLTIILERDPALFQKMASGWRTVSPQVTLNQAIQTGKITPPQWDFLLSCMGPDSPEFAFFKAAQDVSRAFEAVHATLTQPDLKSDLATQTLLIQISDRLADLRKSVDALLVPFNALCASARGKLPEKLTKADEDWYSMLVVSRVSLRNFALCAASLQYALFDEDSAPGILPTVEAGPLDRNRTESVQVFTIQFSPNFQPWLSLNALLFGDLEHGFPADWPVEARAEMGSARAAFKQMAEAWKKNEAKAFDEAGRNFASALRNAAEELEEVRARVLPEGELDVEALANTKYPASPFKMGLETWYLRLRPFTFAWIFPFAATLILGASCVFQILSRKSEISGDSDSLRVFESFGSLAFWLGFGLFFIGILFTTVGLALRSWIMNRAPVTNMFETIVFVAWSAGVLGICLTFRVQFARMISLGWNAAKVGPCETPAGKTFRAFCWSVRVLLAAGIFFLLGFYGLGNGSGYTAIRLTPALAVGAAVPSLSAWIEWLAGVLMLGVFLWWVPLFLIAPLAGCWLYVTKNQWSDEDRGRVERQRFQRPFFACASAFVVFLISWIAVSFPDVFKPDLRNLAPILRDNYWLAVHVITIVASYGAGMLAWGLANGSLVCYIFGRYGTDAAGKRTPPEICRTLSELLYRCMQAAVLLLVIGTILGGLWADVSWGRFWSWDRKEVWALISLFVYLLILHGRYVRLLGEFTLAVGSVLGAFAIIMAWYGVNYVMGSALHGYGAGSGSLIYAWLVVGANCLLILGAVVRYSIEMK
ncbi:MAG: cytochrome c biogenesis protein CcsA [Thermoguttaceae bacterium]|nr:cytochrome c biogenesis protein CcsA [Thermoguttaceae bacterium]